MSLDTLFQSPWLFWIVLTLIFAILEVGVPIFAFSFVSVASAITALVSMRWGWSVQAVTFLAGTLLTLLILRPRLLSRLQKSHTMPSRSQALVGAVGVVTEALDSAAGTGRVQVEGQDWAAKSQTPISVGKQIKVENHDGIVLIIKEM